MRARSLRHFGRVASRRSGKLTESNFTCKFVSEPIYTSYRVYPPAVDPSRSYRSSYSLASIRTPTTRIPLAGNPLDECKQEIDSVLYFLKYLELGLHVNCVRFCNRLQLFLVKPYTISLSLSLVLSISTSLYLFPRSRISFKEISLYIVKLLNFPTTSPIQNSLLIISRLRSLVLIAKASEVTYRSASRPLLK